MDVAAVIDQCNAIIADRRYSRHPFVVNFAQDRPSEAMLGRWALQKYHQTYTQNRIFSTIHSKTDFEDVRQFMMVQLVAEETAINCGTASHYNLVRRFAEACGVPATEFAPHSRAPEVQAYLDTLLSLVRDEHFTVGLLAIYAIECQSGESAGTLLAALRAHYRFSEAELEWFTIHSEEDDDHADLGLELVTRYAPGYDGFATAAPPAVTRLCDAWLRLHDFYASRLSRTPALDTPALDMAVG